LLSLVKFCFYPERTLVSTTILYVDVGAVEDEGEDEGEGDKIAYAI
jgi:hypothetical protein